MTPETYKPETPQDLIGSARTIGEKLLAHCNAIKGDKSATFKTVLYGHPGNGKTTLAEMLARALGQSVDVQTVNGRNVTIDVVRDWQFNNAYGSLFGAWKVKLINECDLIPTAAQDLLLTFLDEMRGGNAVIGTSNMHLENLSERFKTRFRMVQISGAQTSELRQWLMERWEIPLAQANWIATTACGNVRQALLQAGNWITLGDCGGALPSVETMKRNRKVA